MGFLSDAAMFVGGLVVGTATVYGTVKVIDKLTEGDFEAQAKEHAKAFAAKLSETGVEGLRVVGVLGGAGAAAVKEMAKPKEASGQLLSDDEIACMNNGQMRAWTRKHGFKVAFTTGEGSTEANQKRLKKVIKEFADAQQG